MNMAWTHGVALQSCYGEERPCEKLLRCLCSVTFGFNTDSVIDRSGKGQKGERNQC